MTSPRSKVANSAVVHVYPFHIILLFMVHIPGSDDCQEYFRIAESSISGLLGLFT
jgi:hypothetical protein